MERQPNSNLLSAALGVQDFTWLRWLPRVLIEPSKSQEPVARAAELPELTSGMAQGEEGAWRDFSDRYFNRLLRYLLVLTANEHNAREALQLTLLRVARHVRRFESEAAFWSWLTVLARSSVVDEARKSKRYFNFLQRFFEHRRDQSEAIKEPTDARLGELLAANLSALEEADRELLRRKYERGESVRAIAEAMSLSEKAVESRLVRARQKLRELLVLQIKHER